MPQIERKPKRLVGLDVSNRKPQRANTALKKQIKRHPVYSRYSVSDAGVVFGPRAGILRTCLNKAGYKLVNVYLNGEMVSAKVHRLVIETFIGPIPEGMHINHKNGIKTDNRLENLEIVTPKENSHHSLYVLGNLKIGEDHPSSKFSNSERYAIQKLKKQNGWTAPKIAKAYNCKVTSIESVLRGHQFFT